MTIQNVASCTVTGRGYKVPNGAIYTTVGDLARFASFLMEQGPESVLKTTSLERFQRQLAVPADMGLTSGCGIGFQIDRRDNYVAFGTVERSPATLR